MEQAGLDREIQIDCFARWLKSDTVEERERIYVTMKAAEQILGNIDRMAADE